MHERLEFRRYPDEPEYHSGLGIASFLLAIGAALLVFLLFVAAGMVELSEPDGLQPDSPLAILVGLGMGASLLLALLGLGLGIGGVCQRNRKTVFAILGIVFNSLVVVGLVLLVAIGLATTDR